MNPIKELYDGEHVYSQYLVSQSNRCVNSKGKPYLNLTLQDRTGEISAKKWEIEEGDLEVFTAGNIVAVEGEVLSYNGFLQMKVLSGELIPLEDVDASRFVPVAPVPLEELEAKLKNYVQSLAEGDLKTLTAYLIKKFYKKYVDYPAASRNHHNFAHGLLFHSLSMADDAEALSKLYPSLNRDILVAGALLHDIGKTIELSGPVSTRYTTEGKLLGHISIMQAEIRMAAKELKMEGEIPMLLEHMVLSHHGKAEYGSPVPPLTREAIALSMIDDFDARMVMVDKAYEGVKPGEFTQKSFPLGDIALYKPLYEKK